MRTRYTINADGELEARDGTILGRVVGITIDFTPPSQDAVEYFALQDEQQQTALLPSPEEEVWATYAQAMKTRRVMDAGDVLTIKGALKVASVAECQRAVAGCAASDWHMGRDPQTGGTSYKQLSQILKGKRGGRTTREQVDFFIDIADKAGVGSEGVSAIDKTKLSRCKVAVMTAWEFPADDRAAAAGDEARLWLEQHGIQVDMNGTGTELGRPSFRSVS